MLKLGKIDFKSKEPPVTSSSFDLFINTYWIEPAPV